jgi:uncharacterized iron-regulated protein
VYDIPSMRVKACHRRFSGHVLFVLGSWWLAGGSVPLAADIQKFEQGQILETSTGQPTGFEALAAKLAMAEVIYLGEEHHNRSHIDAALTILRSLIARKQRPVLGLEMFSWDGQAGMDHYLSNPEITTDTFLEEAHWKQNWGGAYEEYEPLIILARDHHLSLMALNPPRPLVREIATDGIEKVRTKPEMAQWGMRDETFVEDPEYRDRILKQLRSCHEGLTAAAYERMYEASVFRDESMAKTIADRLRGLPEGAGPIVSYTGGGHIQYRLPIPNRVVRRYGTPLRQVTLYLAALDPNRSHEVNELLQPAIADYIWLTPSSPQGSSRRCL